MTVYTNEAINRWRWRRPPTSTPAAVSAWICQCLFASEAEWNF